MLPLLIFASARADLPFTPINYRLSAEGFEALIDRLPDPLGDRRRPLPRHGRRRGQAGDGFRRVPRPQPRTAEPAAEFADPDAVASRAVHLGHHVEAEGRRALPQQPDQLHHRHRRIRLGRAGRRRADLRAAVPHRRGQRGAVEPVRGPKDGVPAQLRRARVGAAGRRRGGHHRDRGADHAGPHRHRARRRRRASAADAAQPGLRRLEGRRCRWCARHSTCCRTSVSSTPTG